MTESKPGTAGGEALIDRALYPALHSILHRYGIQPGDAVGRQIRAREELAVLLGSAEIRLAACREELTAERANSERWMLAEAEAVEALAAEKEAAELRGAQTVLETLQNWQSVEHDAIKVLKECAGALESKGFKSYPGALLYIAEKLDAQWLRVSTAKAAAPPAPASAPDAGLEKACTCTPYNPEHDCPKHGHARPRDVSCSNCYGRGWSWRGRNETYVEFPCEHCKGSGRVPRPETGTGGVSRGLGSQRGDATSVGLGSQGSGGLKEEKDG
jgi:hypothetical protein